jgi:hypothetical protein
MALNEADLHWNRTVGVLRTLAQSSPEFQKRFWKECPPEKKAAIKDIVKQIKLLKILRDGIERRATEKGIKDPNLVVPFSKMGFQVDLRTMLREEISDGTV